MTAKKKHGRHNSKGRTKAWKQHKLSGNQTRVKMDVLLREEEQV